MYAPEDTRGGFFIYIYNADKLPAYMGIQIKGSLLFVVPYLPPAPPTQWEYLKLPLVKTS